MDKSTSQKILQAAQVGEGANMTGDMHLLSEESGTSPLLSEMKCRREFSLNAFSLGNSEPLRKCLCTDFCPFEGGAMFLFIFKVLLCNSVFSKFQIIKDLHCWCQVCADESTQ